MEVTRLGSFLREHFLFFFFHICTNIVKKEEMLCAFTCAYLWSVQARTPKYRNSTASRSKLDTACNINDYPYCGALPRPYNIVFEEVPAIAESRLAKLNLIMSLMDSTPKDIYLIKHCAVIFSIRIEIHNFCIYSL